MKSALGHRKRHLIQNDLGTDRRRFMAMKKRKAGRKKAAKKSRKKTAKKRSRPVGARVVRLPQSQ
jgi:hypothetical protein